MHFSEWSALDFRFAVIKVGIVGVVMSRAADIASFAAGACVIVATALAMVGLGALRRHYSPK